MKAPDYIASVLIGLASSVLLGAEPVPVSTTAPAFWHVGRGGRILRALPGVELIVEVSPWARASGPVPISCVLRNNGQRDVLTARPDEFASRHPWFGVGVRDEARHRLASTESGRRLYPRLRRGDSNSQMQVLTIHPGEEFRQDYDLAQWFVFPGPGTYTARVGCRARLPSGEELLQTTVETSVRIIDPPAAEPATAPASATPARPARRQIRFVDQPPGMELIVEASPGATASGPVSVSWVLRNKGERDVHLDPSPVRSAHPWFAVIVRDERRHELAMTELGSRPQPPTREPVERLVIHPGEEFRQSYDLAQWYVFPGPGTYTVRIACRASLDASAEDCFHVAAEGSARIIDASDKK